MLQGLLLLSEVLEAGVFGSSRLTVFTLMIHSSSQEIPGRSGHVQVGWGIVAPANATWLCLSPSCCLLSVAMASCMETLLTELQKPPKKFLGSALPVIVTG